MILIEKIKALFFKNIGVKQTIAKNTFWLFGSEIIVRAVSLVSAIYVIRVLGAEEYGKFAFAFSFVSLASIFAELGIIDLSTREFSLNKENEAKFNYIFTLELFLSGLVLIFSIASSFLITKDFLIREMIWALAVSVLSATLFATTFSFFRSRQKMELEAFTKILQAVISTLAVLFVIFLIPSAKNLSFAYMFANLLVMAVVLLIFNFAFYKMALRLSKKTFRMIKDSWPLSFGFVAGWVYISTNSVLLGYFNLITENGWYGAASKIALAALIPADLIARSFYPALSNFFNSSKENFQHVFNYFLEAMIFLAMPILFGGIAVSEKIMSFFYGQNFIPAGIFLQMLFYIIAIGFLTYPCSLVLVVAGKQKKNFLVMALGGIINILLAFFLVRFYGAYGAVFSTIVASLIVLIISAVFAKNELPEKFFDNEKINTIFCALCASLVMFFLIKTPAISNLNIFYIIFAGSFIYFFACLVFSTRIRKIIFSCL